MKKTIFEPTYAELKPGKYVYFGVQLLTVDDEGTTTINDSVGVYSSQAEPDVYIMEDTIGCYGQSAAMLKEFMEKKISIAMQVETLKVLRAKMDEK